MSSGQFKVLSEEEDLSLQTNPSNEQIVSQPREAAILGLPPPPKKQTGIGKKKMRGQNEPAEKSQQKQQQKPPEYQEATEVAKQQKLPQLFPSLLADPDQAASLPPSAPLLEEFADEKPAGTETEMNVLGEIAEKQQPSSFGSAHSTDYPQPSQRAMPPAAARPRRLYRTDFIPHPADEEERQQQQHDKELQQQRRLNLNAAASAAATAGQNIRIQLPERRFPDSAETDSRLLLRDAQPSSDEIALLDADELQRPAPVYPPLPEARRRVRLSRRQRVILLAIGGLCLIALIVVLYQIGLLPRSDK